jgi:hypothetical protein
LRRWFAKTLQSSNNDLKGGETFLLMKAAALANNALNLAIAPPWHGDIPPT